MRVRVSEIDQEILYMVARGIPYKQIAGQVGLSLQTVKNRMAKILKVFAANSLPHLIAMLIASDVLRVHDLYFDLEVEVFEYKRNGGGGSRRSYRLEEVRP